MPCPFFSTTIHSNNKENAEKFMEEGKEK